MPRTLGWMLIVAGCLAGPGGRTQEVSAGGDFAVRGRVEVARVPSVGGAFAVTGELSAATRVPAQGADFAAALSLEETALLLLPATAEVPELRIDRQGDEILLSWTDATGVWRLEAAGTLPPGDDWREWGGTPVPWEGRLLLRVPIGSAAGFYRLRR